MTQHDARLIIFDSFVSLFATELVSGLRKPLMESIYF